MTSRWPLRTRVLGAAALVVATLVGCSAPFSETAVPVRVSPMAITPGGPLSPDAAEPARLASPRCDNSSAEPGTVDQEPDYPDLLWFGGRTYFLVDVSTLQPGGKVGTVRCRLIGSGTPRGYEPVDGDSALLDAGTPLYAVVGRPVAQALLSVDASQTLLWTTDDPAVPESGVTTPSS